MLIKPTIEWQKELLEYRNDYLSQPTIQWIDGSSGLSTFLDISEWLNHLILYESYETIPNKSFVTGEQYIYVRETDSKIVGMIHFRHDLNEFLLKIGGHIGYSVAPSERRKGYGTKMLKELLQMKKESDYDKFLITCNDDNFGSAKIIENNGGILENKIYDESDNQLIRRYWIKN